MTAVYMTRMMLYTFHGPNRTGDAERQHFAEAPWIMTGPLVVLAALTLVGGWLNLPEFAPLGAVGGLDKWLEPVVGAATKRVIGGATPVAPGLELGLVALAVLIAAVGIGIAVARLKPQTLVPKSQSPQEEGFEKVLVNKYYVDEIYDDAIVKPIVGTSRGLLWRGIDAGLIDGLGVNGAAVPDTLRRMGRFAVPVGTARHVRVGAGHRSSRGARRRDRAVIRFQHRNSCSAF